jgi:phosphoglycerate-specific signal transduction histidine kinase
MDSADEETSVPKPRRRSPLLPTILSIIFTIPALVSVIFGFYRSAPLRETPTVTQTKTIEFDNRINANTTAISNIQKRLDQIGSLPPDAKTTIQIAQLRDELQKTQKEVNALNDAILASPTNALSVPLLRRDVDDLSKRIDNLSSDITSQASAVLDQFRWIIGTVVLGVLSLAISNFLRRPGS